MKPNWSGSYGTGETQQRRADELYKPSAFFSRDMPENYAEIALLLRQWRPVRESDLSNIDALPSQRSFATGAYSAPKDIQGIIFQYGKKGQSSHEYLGLPILPRKRL